MDCDLIIKKAEEIVKPILERLSYELVEITCKKIERDYHLTVYIYSNNGVTLEDCVLVDREITQPLNDASIMKGESYVLNISSPGLDRPIKNDDDFRRNIGVKVDLVKINEENKKNIVVGYIRDFNDSQVSIETTQRKIISVERSSIKTLMPHLEF